MSEYIVNMGDEHESPFSALAKLSRVDSYADVREKIVRCRDCKYARDAIWPARLNIPSDYLDCLGELVETWDYYIDEPNMNPVKPDGFCAWGKRKVDGDN